MRPEIELFRSIHLGAKSPLLDFVSLVFSWSALGWLPPLVALLLLLSPKTKSYTAPILLSSLLGGLIIVHAIKDAMPRPRPSNLSFAQPMEAHRQSSFPSGHTTLAFCTATSAFWVARRRGHKFVGGVMFPWAAMVGWSRVYRGVHWPSDVVAGACLGLLVGSLVEMAFRKFGGDGGEPEAIPAQSQ
jgi:undecaprenyl-diphosphatase